MTALADIARGLTQPIAEILGRVIPDPEARERASRELLGLLLGADQPIHAVNGQEAQHPSLFVAGWRPAIGWICAITLGWQYVLVPLGLWAAACFGLHLPTPPALDERLWELMVALLGIAGLRTWEKARGLTR